jgi:hypothetical protein
MSCKTVKLFVVVFLVCIVIPFSPAQSKENDSVQNPLVGTWQGEDGGEIGSFIFMSDKTVVLVIEGSVAAQGVYEIIAQEPVTAELKMPQGEQTITLLAVIQEKNTLHVSSNEGGGIIVLHQD